MKKIKKYKVRDSKKNFSDTTIHINTLNYQGYSADLIYAGNNKIISSTLFDYKLLLLELKKIKNVRFVTHYEYLNKDIDKKNEILIAIRHDIDSDIVAAVQQAELENELGIVSSWYILHTAPYYGYFKDDIFYRHNCNAYYYKKLYDLGHDVGLHTDPLLVYQNFKIDGAEAVKTEIEWLRSLGIDIKGTLAHNSKSVYGAVNYEIFKGRNEEKEAIKDGKWAPLGILDEKELYLEYEGNELLWQKDIPMEYGAIRNLNEWRWVKHEKDIKSGSIEVDYRFTNQEHVIRDITKSKPGTLVTLVVHPLYYGSRIQINKSPVKPFNKENLEQNQKLGWITNRPNTFLSVTNFEEYHAINKTNELGMIDFLTEDQNYDDYIRILVLGSDNTHAKRVGIKRHYTSYLEDLLNSLGLEKKFKIYKLAGDNMGIDRLYSWYEKVVDNIKPHHILLAMPEELIQKNIPLIWAKQEGFSSKHLPGDYICFNPEISSYELQKSSKNWKIRQIKKQKYNCFPNTNILFDDILESDVRYKTKQIQDYIVELYSFAIKKMKTKCSDIILFQEDQYTKQINGIKELSKKIAKNNNCEFIDIDNNDFIVNYSDGKTLRLLGHALVSETLFLKLKDKLLNYN